MNQEHLTNDELINYIYQSNTALNNCTIEIINFCTFKCNHCYMPNSPNHLMDFNMYKEILKQLDEIGCLWILITGGEPLLHPEFKKFYTYAKEKGFLVSVNTNGYLIDDNLIQLFIKYQPYAVEISLYGYDDKSYQQFTHCSNCFLKIDNNIKKMLDKNININLKSVLVKQNYQYFNKIRKYADSFPCPFRYDYVIFPKVNSISKGPNSELLSTKMIIDTLKEDPNSYITFKDRYCDLSYNKNTQSKVFQCSGGENGIYIDSFGNINMCVAVMNDNYNINKFSIQEARTFFKKNKERYVDNKSKCAKCYKKSICRYCPGRFKLETGNYSIPPTWYCNIANNIIRNYGVDGILYNNQNKIQIDILKSIYPILKENYQFLYQITEDDFFTWAKNVMNDEDINTYVLTENHNPIGYIQYVLMEKEICLSEIQIDKKHQGDKKTFKKLMRDFVILSDLKEQDVVYINIHPKNKKSQEVFTGIGFRKIKDHRYEITGEKLMEKFLKSVTTL